MSGSWTPEQAHIIFHCSSNKVGNAWDSMSYHEEEGKRKRIEGEVRKDVGKVTGDKSEQVRGEGEKFEGRIEQGLGEAKRKVERK